MASHRGPSPEALSKPLKKVHQKIHVNLQVQLKVEVNLQVNLNFEMKVQLNFFFYIKVHAVLSGARCFYDLAEAHRRLPQAVPMT